jgi:hypothetical protein
MKKYEKHIKTDLGSGASRCGGSSPLIRTIYNSRMRE